MRIEVRLFATLLTRYAPDMAVGEARQMDVEPGATVGQVMRLLGLPEDEVKVIMRNHRQAQLSDLLTDGDRLAFIPAVGGG